MGATQLHRGASAGMMGWPAGYEEREAMNLFTEHARELVAMPPEWDAYEWEAIGRESASTAAKLIRVTGAVAPLKTRGKYKGYPNWDKLDRDTVKTAYFTPHEHEAWLVRWEQKTGKCADCMGRGERSVGWSAAGGTRHKPCEKCGATGKTTNAGIQPPPVGGRLE